LQTETLNHYQHQQDVGTFQTDTKGVTPYEQTTSIHQRRL